MSCRNHVARIKPCLLCDDMGWVCENHPDQPWEGPHACTCGRAGMPCPECNHSEDDRRGFQGASCRTPNRNGRATCRV